MSKPDSTPVPNPYDHQEKPKTHNQQEPLSGSKKVKQLNHTRHHNPQG
ncbi:small acid-soluble spore protein P [Paenibacillus sepulcri]|uniref:Small acid-soluble spore protein P n=1 Tax=Paenibacillus sepulcri TaxID=359917 RepID=A0ABS7BXK2_9BACL|nr:small acid-soluble spore protein P [Paenibacillus sepulcri]